MAVVRLRGMLHSADNCWHWHTYNSDLAGRENTQKQNIDIERQSNCCKKYFWELVHEPSLRKESIKQCIVRSVPLSNPAADGERLQKENYQKLHRVPIWLPAASGLGNQTNQKLAADHSSILKQLGLLTRTQSDHGENLGPTISIFVHS